MEYSLAEFEINILLWIQENIRTPLLTPVMQFITSLGNYGSIWIVVCILLLLYKKTRKVGIMAVVSLVLNALLVNVILKTQIMRIRPFVLEDALILLTRLPSDSSFPSGHTSASFAVAVIVWKCLPKKAGVPAILLACLIGISRLYVGVHFPTDVLAGVVIGTVVALGTWYFFQKYIYKNQKQTKTG